ncbi:putative g2-specific protein kinase protein [Botrytis fragariae]|uniref:non-specific serine/threonine protein kinase n=1 Tax=Botrytis fragariae TaxID=1964551 RepID=A0A8H6EK52_9HELO|nr:putative g2-specific protein kinase protein [Botrytis fragariae]KAF5875237.1 putative g2-specific protein kinase protein [Botrytis fragariae]
MVNPFLPEMTDVPAGWVGQFDNNDRVFFRGPNGYLTYDHPMKGAIPKPWQLKVDRSVSNPREYYYNTQTRENSYINPRFKEEIMNSSLLGVSRLVRESATMTVNTDGTLEKSRRQAIGNKNIRHLYTIVKTLDAGNGAIGGMNGGVHVVRLKGTGKLYVEKRFKKDDLQPLRDGTPGMGVVEIGITHRVMHGGLAGYINGFIEPNDIHPASASLFLEFCDLGSLDDLIKCHAQRLGTRDAVDVPERFVWHAIVGLCDALSYLWGGKSFITNEKHTGTGPAKGWKPILHRDMKPDNILIRSRSTNGATKYPFLVISDFGLATDNHKQGSGACGTRHFWAPELLWDPPATNNWHLSSFPPNQYHTHESDLYALGVCIYNLCRPTNAIVHGQRWLGALSHFKFESYPTNRDEIDLWLSSRRSRKSDLDAGSSYSPYLRNVVKKMTSWNVSQRGAAHQLEHILIPTVKKCGYYDEDFSPSEALPAWAIKKHDYHSR